MSQERKATAARPLTARQVVASTLLGVEPPRLPSRHLVRAGELFGISDGTTRVALSRMLASGELLAEDGWYRLTAPSLLARQARQSEVRHPALLPWAGDWTVHIVADGRRPATVRSELRAATRTLHLAELREGVWARPANLDPERFPDARKVLDAQCHPLRSELAPGASVTDAELCGRLWDLAGWAATAREQIAAMTASRRALHAGGPDDLRAAWELSAAVLRHLLADPLLPSELLPRGWPGDRLRRAYDAFDREFKDRWRALVS